jgi:osmotically inducible protein OsmC
MTTKLEKVLYTAHANATGGRDGRAKTSDGRIDVVLKPPKEMGGTGEGVNPEQLFAAGYAACFIGAIKFVGGQEKIAVPADTSIESSVSIGPIPQGFGIAVELKVSIPGVDRAVAQSLIEKAHQVCPYSNATRGNIEVKLSLA